MKDLYGLTESGLPPELVARLTGVSREQLLADALTKQSLTPVENMGGPGAKLSWTQGLDKVLKAYLGRRGADRATAERGAIEAEAETGRKSAMEAYLAQKRGQAGVPYVDTTGAEGPQGMTAGVAGDPRRAIEDSQLNPYLRGSPFIAGERRDLAMKEERDDEAAAKERLVRLKAQLDPVTAPKDPEAVRLAQIANDPRRNPAERQAAADALKKMTTAGPLTQVNVNSPIDNFKNEKTLRDEFGKASENFVKVRDAFSQVRDSLAGDITAPATLAAATKFMKMLDPESVVRESELNMALKSSGLLDRFTNLHNVVLKGQILTPTQAAEIQRIAGVLYGTAEGNQKRISDYYTKLAQDYKLDPARIVRDLSPAPAPAKAPASGAKPAAGVPVGVEPAVWAVMTPEEKALWPK